MPKLEDAAKAGAASVKKNWIFFLLAAIALAGLTLWYEHKTAGGLTSKFARLPFFGKFFGAAAVIVALLGGAAHAPRTLTDGTVIVSQLAGRA